MRLRAIMGNPKLGGNPQITVCYFHSTGGCSKPSCKYQHPIPPLDEKGQLIICRIDKTGKICRANCGFRHPSREQPQDLRDVLSPPLVMSNRRVQLTDYPEIQNTKQFSTPEPTSSASTSCVTSTPQNSKSNQKQSPMWPSTSARSAVKRKSSSSGEKSPGPRTKRWCEVRFEEHGYSSDISVSQALKEKYSELSDMKKKITEKEDELARLKSSHMNHLTVKDEEIEDQKKKVENLTSKLEEKEAKLRTQDAKLKDQERRLKMDGAKLKGQESKLSSLVVKLNTQATKLKNQETKIRDQDEKLKEGEAKMAERLREKETLDVQLRENLKEFFEVQEEKLKNQEVKLQGDLNEAKLQIEQLQSQLKERNIALKKVEESKVETERNGTKSLDKLKEENEILKKSARYMEALNLSVKNLMHKTNLDSNLKSVKAKKEFDQKEKDLVKRNTALETEKKELEKVLTQSRETQGKTERDYQQLREEYESQSADLTNFKSDIEASCKEKEELLGSLTARSTEAHKLEREKEELRENLKNMEEERDGMDEENTKLSREIELLKKQLTSVNSDLNRNKTEEKENKRTKAGEVVSQQKLLEVNTVLEVVKKERDEMRTLLRTKDEVIKNLENEILPFVRTWCKE